MCQPYHQDVVRRFAFMPNRLPLPETIDDADWHLIPKRLIGGIERDQRFTHSSLPIVRVRTRESASHPYKATYYHFDLPGCCFDSYEELRRAFVP